MFGVCYGSEFRSAISYFDKCVCIASWTTKGQVRSSKVVVIAKCLGTGYCGEYLDLKVKDNLRDLDVDGRVILA